MTDGAERPADEARQIEQFAAQCAHDFNNLLTGILGNLELMNNRSKRSGITNFDSYINGARNAAGRAADFTQRLLAFSGRASSDPETVPVNRLVTDLVELTREQNHPVEATLDPAAGTVFCDPDQLELALQELLTNAREASPEAGTIRISSAATNGHVTISITDTGPGMTAETLARATDPFFSTRQNGAGKGLGLAIAARFCRDAGGTLALTSQPASGTTATITLPRLEPDTHGVGVDAS
jgi:signal transduction histidine kinase